MVFDKFRGLRSRDIQNREPKVAEFGDYLIASREPVSVADLSGGHLPERKDIGRMPEPYKRLGKTPFDVLSISNKVTGKKEYVLVMPPLHAEEANWVLYAAGANKDDGLNTVEMIVHLDALAHMNSERGVRRRTLHEHIPGWKAFQNNGGGADVRRLLVENSWQGEFFKNSSDTLTPVVRWTAEEGILLDPIQPELAAAISHALPHKVPSGDNLSTVLGFPFLGTFSPDIRVTKYGRYNPTSPLLQEIGSIQMLPYFFLTITQSRMPGFTIDPEMDLQQSSLLHAATTYLESGELPSIRSEKTPKQTAAEIISRRAWEEFEELDLTTTREYTLPNNGFIKVDVDSAGNRHLRKSRPGGPYITIIENDKTVDGQNVKVINYEFSGGIDENTYVTFKLTTSPKGNSMKIGRYGADHEFIPRKHKQHLLQAFGIDLP